MRLASVCFWPCTIPSCPWLVFRSFCTHLHQCESSQSAVKHSQVELAIISTPLATRGRRDSWCKQREDYRLQANKILGSTSELLAHNPTIYWAINLAIKHCAVALTGPPCTLICTAVRLLNIHCQEATVRITSSCRCGCSEPDTLKICAPKQISPRDLL